MMCADGERHAVLMGESATTYGTSFGSHCASFSVLLDSAVQMNIFDAGIASVPNRSQLIPSMRVRFTSTTGGA